MKDKKKASLESLTKEEFDKAYEDLLTNYKDKFEVYPLPTKQEILEIALNSGNLSIQHYITLKSK